MVILRLWMSEIIKSVICVYVLKYKCVSNKKMLVKSVILMNMGVAG